MSEGWLMSEYERAKERSSKVPDHARPLYKSGWLEARVREVTSRNTQFPIVLTGSEVDSPGKPPTYGGI